MIPITLGEPRSHGGLTLFPLFHADAGDSPEAGSPGIPGSDRDPGPGFGGPTAWILLADALAAGTLEIREVGDGIVGELIAINRGPEPVLILDGEQLVGAKQNRTTGRTILLDAESETRIPVSCMEQGRWAHRTRAMAYGDFHSPSTVRVHARRVEAEAARVEAEMARLEEMMRAEEEARAGEEAARAEEAGRAEAPAGAVPDSHPSGDAPDRDDLRIAAARYRERLLRQHHRASTPSALLSMAQGGVWSTIRESSERAGVRSETGALDEVYTSRRERLEDRAGEFPSEPGQVGLLAFVNGAPAGLDLLPGRGIYARVHGRLVRAYLFQALDAAAEGGVGDEAPREDAEAFLAASIDADRRPLETVGLGRYASLAAPDVVGAELVVDDGIVHMSAFNAMG